MHIDRTVGFADGPKTEVVSPADQHSIELRYHCLWSLPDRIPPGLVIAYTLAESPRDPFHRKLRQLCCLRCRFDCYRVERTSSRAEVAPAEVQRLSRSTVTPLDQLLGAADALNEKHLQCNFRGIDPLSLSRTVPFPGAHPS